MVSDSVECIKIATEEQAYFDSSHYFNLLAKEAQLFYFKLSESNNVKFSLKHTVRDDNKLADALAGYALHCMETEGIESQVFENFLPEGLLKQTYEGDLRILKQTYEGDLRNCSDLKHIHRLVGLHVKRDIYGGSMRLDRKICIMNLHHQPMSMRLDRKICIMNLHHQPMFASSIKFDRIEGA